MAFLPSVSASCLSLEPRYIFWPLQHPMAMSFPGQGCTGTSLLVLLGHCFGSPSCPGETSAITLWGQQWAITKSSEVLPLLGAHQTHTGEPVQLGGSPAPFQENPVNLISSSNKRGKQHCFPKGLWALGAGRGGEGRRAIRVSKKFSSLAGGQGLFMWISSLRQETLGCWKSL